MFNVPAHQVPLSLPNERGVPIVHIIPALANSRPMDEVHLILPFNNTPQKASGRKHQKPTVESGGKSEGDSDSEERPMQINGNLDPHPNLPEAMEDSLLLLRSDGILKRTNVSLYQKIHGSGLRIIHAPKRDASVTPASGAHDSIDSFTNTKHGDMTYTMGDVEHTVVGAIPVNTTKDGVNVALENIVKMKLCPANVNCVVQENDTRMMALRDDTDVLVVTK